MEQSPHSAPVKRTFITRPENVDSWVQMSRGPIAELLTLGAAAVLAKAALGQKLIAWWCDPTINLDMRTPPITFDRDWPADSDKLQVEEVAFYAERAVWRAVRTFTGGRFVFIEETTQAEDTQPIRVVYTPARLHGFRRFSAADTGRSNVLLREWHVGDELLGFTITQEQR